MQHQLVEQVAKIENATGIEKIVGDLWATGMDEAKVNAQGLEPLKADLAAIDGLQDKDAIAEGQAQLRAHLNVLAGGDEARAHERLARGIPMKRIGEPDDVAYCVLYLASDESRFVNGAEFKIDGGATAQ